MKDPVVPLETVLAIVASTFGVVMGVAPALQIRKMLTERSSRDVSIGYFAILAIGSTLLASYGVSLGNLAILIPNVVAFLADITTMLVAHRLRRQEQLNVPGFSDGDGDELGPTHRQAEWQPAK